MFLCYDSTLEGFHGVTSFCILNEIHKAISGSTIFDKPRTHSWQTGWETIDQTLTIVRLIKLWSTELALSARSNPFWNHAYDFRPNWPPLSPLTIIIWKITVNYFFSVYCTYFIFLLFSIIFLGVGKIGGPRTGSMEGVHGPGVHVLYFPLTAGCRRYNWSRHVHRFTYSP